MSINGLDRTAILLLALGEGEASEVLRHMAKVRDPMLPEAERMIERLFGLKAASPEQGKDRDEDEENST